MMERSNHRTILLFVFVFAIFAGLSFFATRAAIPKLREVGIRKEISGANYCAATSDCVVVDAQCPFGCYVAVNKNEASRIETLIKNYKSNCVYSCVELKGVDCLGGKCVVKN